jgi:hypothetical protein
MAGWPDRGNRGSLEDAQDGSRTCPWRIARSRAFSADVAILLGSCGTRLVILFLHLLATVARLAGPGDARSVIAESVLVNTN